MIRVARRTMRAVAIQMSVALLTVSAAAAQEEEAPKGWYGNADLGYTLTAGNSETTNLALGFAILDELERSKWTFSGSYIRATSEGDETANKGDLLAQYDFFPRPRFFVFGRLAAGFNKPADLDSRFVPAVGVGVVAAKTEQLELAFTAGTALRAERFSNDSTSTSFDGTAGQSFSLNISETTELLQLLNYTPELEDFGNYLVHFEISLTTAITQLLGLKVAFVDDFRSRPFIEADGTERSKNDLTFITGVSFKFD